MLAETLVTQLSPCYSAVSASLTNPLPDCSNYSPFCHTHYLTPDQYFSSFFTKPLRLILILHCYCALLQNLSRELGRTQCLEEAELQAEASVDVPHPPLQIVISISLLSLFSLSSLLPFSILSLLPFLISPSLSSILSFSSDQFLCPPKIKTSSFIQLIYLVKCH